ncbi:MAG: hypothetical protein IJL06_06310 [Kiritimatiellae bacterium]|nr:hypothetical protein [Kiritimatiellia bacterium]
MRLSTAVRSLQATSIAGVAAVALGAVWRVVAACLSLPPQHLNVSFPLPLLFALAGFAVVRALQTNVRSPDERTSATAVWVFVALIVGGAAATFLSLSGSWGWLRRYPVQLVQEIVSCSLSTMYFASVAICMPALADHPASPGDARTAGMRRIVLVFGIAALAIVLSSAFFRVAVARLQLQERGNPGAAIRLPWMILQMLPVLLPAFVLIFLGAWIRGTRRALVWLAAAFAALGVAFAVDAALAVGSARSGVVAFSLFRAVFCLAVAIPVLYRRSARAPAPPPEDLATNRPRALDNPAGCAGLLLVLHGLHVLSPSPGGFFWIAALAIPPATGLVLSIAGLFRRPRWPALVGLSVDVLLVLVFAVILFLVASMFDWN